MLPCLWKILSNPTKAFTSFFSIGGYAATFLNMDPVGLVCTVLYWLSCNKPTAALVCLLYVPCLEKMIKPKLVRRAKRNKHGA